MEPPLKPLMTKYECSHILGLRVLQLRECATVLTTQVPEHLRNSFFYIAAKELSEGCLDIDIHREMPLGETITISSKDMDLPDDVEQILLLLST